MLKIKPSIQNVIFLDARPYYDFNPQNMIIYCDPPYRGNNFHTKYFTEFDHDKFWQVMRIWSKNNLVVISESSAPSDFKVIYSFESSITNTTNTHKKYKEYLFVHEYTYKFLGLQV